MADKKKAKPKASDKPKLSSREASPLTDQMRAFVGEYIIDFNGFAAAVRAGYAESGARAVASRLLAREDVQAELEFRMKKLEHKIELKAERVLQEAWGIATADVNELVEYRRTCCRHCYGIDFGYQRTVAEMNRDRRAYEVQRRKDANKDNFVAALYPEFDEQGGIGYDARREPHPDCQECFGQGVGNAFFKDTRNLTPAARALYAGVKQTKDGFQMLLIDKNASLEKLFKHFGLYKVDNEQKNDAFADFLTAVQAKGGKLPIKQ